MEALKNFKDLWKLCIKNIARYSAVNMPFPASFSACIHFFHTICHVTGACGLPEKQSLTLVPCLNVLCMIVKLTYWSQLPFQWWIKSNSYLWGNLELNSEERWLANFAFPERTYLRHHPYRNYILRKLNFVNLWALHSRRNFNLINLLLLMICDT